MHLPARVRTNLVYKLLVFPTLIYSFSRWFPAHLFFPDLKPVTTLSLLFIAIGLIADETILPRFGRLSATAQGFCFMTAAIWSSPFFDKDVSVTVFGALGLGLALGLAEYVMHGWILAQRAKEKHHRP